MPLSSKIPGFKQPRATLIIGGQPEVGAWQEALEQGVTTVINLRPAAEMAGRDEAAEVGQAGLAYQQIPVDGASDITPANARKLWRQVEAAPGTVIVHCASGNRVGALMAIGAVLEGGMSHEDAIEFGKAAGLGSAEARVRDVLRAP